MGCPNCGREVPDGASFCRHCGSRLRTGVAPDTEARGDTDRWPAGTQPAVPAPPAWPPHGLTDLTRGHPATQPPRPTPASAPPRGRGWWLLVAAIVVVTLLLVVLATGMAALVILRGGDENGGNDTPAVSQDPAVTSPDRPADTDGGAVPPDATAPDPSADDPPSPDDYAGGAWFELDLEGVAQDAYHVVVSDDAAVFERETSLVALEFASGRLIEIPTEMENVGMVDIDGRQVVWWEGTYDEGSDEWADEGIFAYRLPSGPRVRLAGKEGSPGYPLVAGGSVTWTQARPSTFSPEEVWEFPILRMRIGADGEGSGDAEVLVPAPTAFVLGDSVWSYDLSPTHLAWEQHWDTADATAGSYVRDLSTGAEVHLGADSWRPSLAGANVAYWAGDGLYLRDMGTDETRLLDPDGDWPELSDLYVAYLRAVEDPDSSGWEIVTLGLRDGSEQVLGVQSTPPWFGSVISVARSHVAYVDEENRPHIFERRR